MYVLLNGEHKRYLDGRGSHRLESGIDACGPQVSYCSAFPRTARQQVKWSMGCLVHRCHRLRLVVSDHDSFLCRCRSPARLLYHKRFKVVWVRSQPRFKSERRAKKLTFLSLTSTPFKFHGHTRPARTSICLGCIDGQFCHRYKSHEFPVAQGQNDIE